MPCFLICFRQASASPAGSPRVFFSPLLSPAQVLLLFPWQGDTVCLLSPFNPGPQHSLFHCPQLGTKGAALHCPAGKLYTVIPCISGQKERKMWLIKTTSLHKGCAHMRRRFLNAERRITLASGKWR